METLRALGYLFETEEDGRHEAAKKACIAVANFIYVRGYGAECAVPFFSIAKSFDHLQKRGMPPALFKKNTVGANERSQSPERYHSKQLAAALLEVLVVHYKEQLKATADKMARHVRGWSSMKGAKVTGTTIINWRKQFSRERGINYLKLVEMTLNEPDPRATIEFWLKRMKGPNR